MIVEFLIPVLLWTFAHVIAVLIAALLCFSWKNKVLGWLGIALTAAATVATLFYMAASFGNHPPEMRDVFVAAALGLLGGSFGAAVGLIALGWWLKERKTERG